MKYNLLNIVPIRFLFLLLLLEPLAVAQQRKNTTNVLVSLIDLSEINVDNLYYINKKKFSPIVSQRYSVAPPITHKGSQQFTLYQKKNTSESGYIPIGHCQLPPQSKRFIVVASFDEQTSPRYIRAFDSEAEALPFGSRLLINLTDTEIRGIYSTLPRSKQKTKKTFFISQSKHCLLKALEPQAPPLTGYYIRIEYQNKETGTWEILCESRWFHSPTERKISLIYNKNKRMYIRNVVDSTLHP